MKTSFLQQRIVPVFRAAAIIVIVIATGLFLGAGVSQMVRAATQQPADLPNDDIAAQAVRDWLRDTKSLKADFLQQGADGQAVCGELTLKQPGQVRFEYEPSVELLIVAREGSIYFIDYEVKQVSRYPIKETPLAPLLRPQSLDEVPFRAVEITDGVGKGTLYVTSEDPEHREYGTLTMVFTRTGPKSVALNAWSVLDGQGNLTQITLENVRENVDVASATFKFKDPRRRAPR
ncbi:MAG: outer membrane lipoprotein carrier protein LolA [Sphingomonadales bacterium]